MVTIAHLVEKIVEQKPFLQEALSRGVINNAALAEELIPQIEKELKKTVKFSAVNMAIRRLAETLEVSAIQRAKFDENSNIIIQSDLIEITLYKSPEIQEKIIKVYSIVNLKAGDFLTITQGPNEIMIITNQKYESKLNEIFSEADTKKIINNLSSLTVNIPIEAVETVGLFYIVTRALNWENINIVDIVSTLTEMTFIISEDDTARAFDILKELIEKNK